MRMGANSDRVAPAMSGENRAPELPEVVSDEAGDSAPWVAKVGFALLLLFAAVVVIVLLRPAATQPAMPGADAAPAKAAEAPSQPH